MGDFEVSRLRAAEVEIAVVQVEVIEADIAEVAVLDVRLHDRRRGRRMPWAASKLKSGVDTVFTRGGGPSLKAADVSDARNSGRRGRQPRTCAALERRLFR